MRDTQFDFSLGELSPYTYGRVDMPWYRSGVRGMENFIALPQGPAQARPGTIRIDSLPYPDKQYRIEQMVIDHDNTIILAICDIEVIAYKLLQDGSAVSAVPITDGVGDIKRTAISVKEADLMELQFAQFEGKMFIVHPDYEMREVVFDTQNQMLSISSFVAYYRKYDEALTYITNDVVAKNGKLWRAIDEATAGTLTGETVYYQDYANSITLDDYTGQILQYDGTETVRGTVVVYNSGLWVLGEKGEDDKDGDYDLWYYPDPLPISTDDEGRETIHWGLCDSRLVKSYSTRRYPGYPPNSGDNAWLHLCSVPTGTTILNEFVTTDPYTVDEVFYYNGRVYRTIVNTPASPPEPIEGVVGVWVFVGEAPTFSSDGQYPNVVIFHDRRLWILGTRLLPGILFGSHTNNIYQFTLGIEADEGMQIKVGTEIAEAAAWGRSRRELVIGLSKSEWIISGGDSPISPLTVFAYPQSRSGSMRNGVIDISDMMVFFQSGGRKLLQFVFSNDTQSYATPEVSQLSEHIFGSGVKEFALQSNPDYIIWCVMEDGSLVGGTYDPQKHIFGWHRHSTDGKFESIAITDSVSGEDEIWVSVVRETDGVEYRSFERFAFRKQSHDSSMVWMDDAEIISVNNGIGYVSPDKYGQTLTVLYGAAAHPDVTADADGKIVFQNALFTQAVVGRAYWPKLKPQKLYPSGSRLDTGVRISRAAIRVYETLGIQVGADEDHLDPVTFRQTSAIMGQAPPLYTGEVAVSVDSTFGDEGWMLIQRNQPFPCMILGVTYELEVGAI